MHSKPFRTKGGIANGCDNTHATQVSQPYLSLEAAWHDAFWGAEDDDSELPLISQLLDQHPGTALEIGCGSGRLMLPLLAAGYDIEGMELSPDMIALAYEQAKRDGLEPIIHTGDMESWQAPRRYAALLAPAFTLQLAAHPGPVLQHWNNWLEPGGGLYLTTFIPYSELLGEIPENTWYPDHRTELDDGRIAAIHTRHQIDHANKQISREHRYTIEGDATTSYQSRQQIRWIEHEEMLKHLENAGFALDQCILDFDLQRPASTQTPDDFDGILTYFAHKVTD